MTAPLGPGYWMHETSGVLRPAVEAYLNRATMTPEQIATIRAYLRQWICAPVWKGEFEDLLGRIDGLTSREAICEWLDDAADWGIDPL
jgi:hypothetical protein